jgi:hypothetical protein
MGKNHLKNGPKKQERSREKVHNLFLIAQQVMVKHQSWFHIYMTVNAIEWQPAHMY